jgi:hypothetical protein
LKAEASMGGVPGLGRAPDLSFAIEEGGALDHAAVPTLRFAVRIDGEQGVPLRSIALNVQLRIAATRRPYEDAEEGRLGEVFGRPEQWGRSLGSLHWTSLSLQVPGFEGSTVAELHVPCTYDFEVTAAKYLAALEGGEVPLEFLFGGMAFYTGPDGHLQVQPIAWNQEAEFRLPVSVWREMMDHHFPKQAWLRLDRDAFDRLHSYKRRKTLLTWEQTVDSLLRAAADDEA